MTDKPIDPSQNDPTHWPPVLGRAQAPLSKQACYLIAVLFSLTLLLTGCSGGGGVKYTDKPKSGPIVILGDSIANGYGVKKGESFVDILSERLGVTIENLGRNGITTGASIERVEKEVLPLKPGLVIIELGGNDALQKVDLETTRANLTTIITRIHKEEIPILLMGVRGGVFKDKYFALYEGLAEEHQLAFLPDMLDGILGNPSLKVDSIHPNAKGHVYLADRVEPLLRPLVTQLKLN